MEDKYRKLVDERIGRALEAGSTGAMSSPKICSPGCASDAGPSDTGTSERDELRKLLDAACRQRETRRRILRRRAVSLAAVFICIFSLLGGLYFKGFFQPEESQAGRSPDKSAAAENGSVVIGGDGNGNMEMWTATYTSFEEIPNAYRQEMVWFGYIPEGYEIESLRIKRTGNLQSISITLKNDTEREIRIEEEKSLEEGRESIASVINYFLYKGTINDMEIYWKQTDNTLKYYFVAGDVGIKITVDENMEKETEAMIASVRIDWNW